MCWPKSKPIRPPWSWKITKTAPCSTPAPKPAKPWPSTASWPSSAKKAPTFKPCWAAKAVALLPLPKLPQLPQLKPRPRLPLPQLLRQPGPLQPLRPLLPLQRWPHPGFAAGQEHCQRKRHQPRPGSGHRRQRPHCAARRGELPALGCRPLLPSQLPRSCCPPNCLPRCRGSAQPPALQRPTCRARLLAEGTYTDTPVSQMRKVIAKRLSGKPVHGPAFLSHDGNQHGQGHGSPRAAQRAVAGEAVASTTWC